MAAVRFAEVHNSEPEGVWAAPGRVNLIGEHTDYNDGFVLPFALEQSTWVAASRRDDGVLHVESLQADEPVRFEVGELAPGGSGGWARYAAGVVWAMRAAGHEVGGLSLVIDGQVPLGSGLSSSAALECAVGVAANDLYALGLERAELARLAQKAENDFVGAPTGGMDQMASMLCTQGNALFLDNRTREVEQVPLDAPALGVRLLVIDTKVSHAHETGGYGERRAQCEQAAREIGVPMLRDVDLDGLDAALAKVGDEVVRRRARHIVTENARVLDTVAALRRDDLSEVGRLMVASHVSLRDDFEVSSPELDVAVDAAMSAGAIGARMTGGGFGGCAIALVREADVDAVGAAVAKAFAGSGYAEPGLLPAAPSQGARREV
ncbi:galactokinase [Motilibacter sp. E257]|uniref:Galactokinase n=2 Tax=Motilibacter deserti TaxID=2714956 RepID=A0ABX0H1P9_9ACTN|nr:galactokinase [Motilibacter deserti]NHC15692.1 galactokinase [Motilibacter deserti]